MMPKTRSFQWIILPFLVVNVALNNRAAQAWLMPNGSTVTYRHTCSQLMMSSRKQNGVDDGTENRPIFASVSTASDSDQQARKQKKNKYAKFSKVENPNTSVAQAGMDPFEALIQESEEKLRKLQKEKEEASAKPVITPVTPDADKPLSFPNNKDIDPYDPTTFGYVEIGTVLGPHGVHGWSRVVGCTDFPERLTTPGMVLHFKPFRKRAPRKVLLANGKCTGPDSFLVQLQDCYDRRQAEKLKGGTLYYSTQQDHVKQEQDLLLSDLVGLQVLLFNDDDTEGAKEHVVGTVGAIVLAEEMCAIPGLGQDMLEVILEARKDEVVKPGTPKDLVLIPMVPEICKKIDLKEQRLWIDPPAGLLDLTYIREEKVRIKGLLAPAKD
jgi:16S rRNA processing protein RimM